MWLVFDITQWYKASKLHVFNTEYTWIGSRSVDIAYKIAEGMESVSIPGE
jgi:hypothetical protein